MKNKKVISLVIGLILVIILLYTNRSILSTESQNTEHIYLIGEAHDVDKILEKENALWYDYYHNQGMRHLFVELPYYTAEFLNIWMKSDKNEILEDIYRDWIGTILHSSDVKEFYERIKSECPETVFHGTDVGHQYATTGERFLDYLENNHLDGTDQYRLTQEAIEQGKYFYSSNDQVYRENKMVENFIREYDQLTGLSIMGIYGSAHTGLAAMDSTNSVPCMANQLNMHYTDTINTEDLSLLAKDLDPFKVDTIRVNGKDYKAQYFGEEDISGFSDEYTYREFWRLENAYEDFKDNPLAQEILPFSNYPMFIEIGQVFIIDYKKADGSTIREYYRSDGVEWNDMPTTQKFTID